MEKKERQAAGFAVRQTGMAYGVGIFIVVFAAVILVLEIRYHVRTIPVWIYLVIAGIVLSGAFVCLEAWNRRLMVMEDTFFYRNLVGKMVKFSLRDIGYGKAACHASQGRDYLRLYDKEGKILCRLECSMRNAERLVWYLHDNDIEMELEKGAEGFIGEIMAQQPVTEEEMGKLSGQIYGEMQNLAVEWQERNIKLGAEFEYGFSCYFMGKMDPKEQMQPLESRFTRRTAKQEGGKKEDSLEAEREAGKELSMGRDGKGLPEDYCCRIELYVKKDGYLVRDRRGRMAMLENPVFYRRKSESREEGDRLYYNSVWQDEMKAGLEWLEIYLPKHRFIQCEETLGFELEKML